MAQQAIPQLLNFAGQRANARAGQQAQAQAVQAEEARRQQIAEQLRNLPPGVSEEQVFGTRPEFQEVDYTPLSQSDPGFARLTADTIAGNLQNVGGANELFGKISAAITDGMKRRVSAFDPNILGNIAQAGENAALALRGRLPGEDVMDIVGNRAELSSLLGTPGAGRAQTAKDLGMTRFGLQTQTGPNLLSNVTSIINSIDPASLRQGALPQDWLMRPSQVAGIAAQENQFDASFQRNQEDSRMFINAMAEPAAAGLFNMDRQALGFLATPNPYAGPGAGQAFQAAQGPSPLSLAGDLAGSLFSGLAQRKASTAAAGGGGARPSFKFNFGGRS